MPGNNNNKSTQKFCRLVSPRVSRAEAAAQAGQAAKPAATQAATAAARGIAARFLDIRLRAIVRGGRTFHGALSTLPTPLRCSLSPVHPPPKSFWEAIFFSSALHTLTQTYYTPKNTYQSAKLTVPGLIRERKNPPLPFFLFLFVLLPKHNCDPKVRAWNTRKKRKYE